MNRDQIRQLAMEHAEDALLRESQSPWLNQSGAGPLLDDEDVAALAAELRTIAGQVARGGAS